MSENPTPEPRAAKFKRERYLVDPKLQIAVVVPLLATLGIVALAYIAAVYLLPGALALHSMTAAETRALFMRVNGIYFAIAIVALGATAIFLTHRVAGPAGVIERAVRGLQNGEYGMRLTLRPGDYLKPLAVAVKDLRNHLREEAEHRRRLVEEIGARLDDGDLPEVRKLLEQLGLQDTQPPSSLEI